MEGNPPKQPLLPTDDPGKRVHIPDPRLTITKGNSFMGPQVTVQEENIKRLLFRGDDRPPSEIFTTGFVSRAPEQPMTYQPKDAQFLTPKGAVEHYKSVAKPASYSKSLYMLDPQRDNQDKPVWFRFIDVAGDMSKRTVVCVTANLAAATLFPLKEKATDPTISPTYIYFCYVASGFNTHRLQVAEGLQALEIELEQMHLLHNDGIDIPQHPLDIARKALWSLYAHELCAKTIPARHVLCALKCQRTWKGATWESGEDYAIDKDSLKWNTHFDVGDGTMTKKYQTAAEYALSQPAFPYAGHSPTPDEGFHAHKRETTKDGKSFIV